MTILLRCDDRLPDYSTWFDTSFSLKSQGSAVFDWISMVNLQERPCWDAILASNCFVKMTTCWQCPILKSWPVASNTGCIVANIARVRQRWVAQYRSTAQRDDLEVESKEQDLGLIIPGSTCVLSAWRCYASRPLSNTILTSSLWYLSEYFSLFYLLF
jgi:hypothetical protein